MRAQLMQGTQTGAPPVPSAPAPACCHVSAPQPAWQRPSPAQQIWQPPGHTAPAVPARVRDKAYVALRHNAEYSMLLTQRSVETSKQRRARSECGNALVLMITAFTMIYRLQQLTPPSIVRTSSLACANATSAAVAALLCPSSAFRACLSCSRVAPAACRLAAASARRRSPSAMRDSRAVRFADSWRRKGDAIHCRQRMSNDGARDSNLQVTQRLKA
jgi:hypothetical protein